jgi:hypothetical protein
VAWYEPPHRIVLGCPMKYVVKVFRKLRALRDGK